MRRLFKLKITKTSLFLGLFLGLLTICSSASYVFAAETTLATMYANPQASDNPNNELSDTANSDQPKSQDWSVHLQTTNIEQRKNNFYSPYSSINSTKGNSSLLSRMDGDNNRSFSFSTTAFFGTRLWEGAEGYYNSEIFEGIPFTGSLVGLGGPQNGELQKGAYMPAISYHARAFIRQTFGLGGGQEYIPEETVNQLAGTIDENRLVLTWGKVASLDFFDINAYSHDPRVHFMNFSVFSMGAYGYAADTRGYTYGLVVELYQNAWTLKAARLAAPTTPNQLEIDYTLTKDYVDQFEITHKHKIANLAGAVRGIGFLQHAYMSNYQDAILYAQKNSASGAPSIFNTRKMNTLFGYGFNAEQAINSDLGIFTRWSWNNNQSETETLDIGRSLSIGTTLQGNQWSRSGDTYGLAWATNGISNSEVRYLQLGGQTMFIGDGAIQYKKEQILETYYSAKLFKDLFLTTDYQKITNPAYNSARGPINIISMRLHFEL